MTADTYLQKVFDRLQEQMDLNWSIIEKARKYIKRGMTPPRGRRVKRGQHGAYYYETIPWQKKEVILQKEDPRKFRIPSHIKPLFHEEGSIQYEKLILNHILHDQYFQWRTTLPKQERCSLLAYQNDSSRINRTMRGFIKKPDSITLNHIENIKSAFENIESKINKQIFLFRGVTADFAQNILDNNGFEDNAFLSTSFDPLAAISYARSVDKNQNVKDAGGFSNIIVYKFQGGKGIFLGAHSEILLPPETKWDVTTIMEIQKLHCIHREGNIQIRRKIRLIHIKPRRI